MHRILLLCLILFCFNALSRAQQDDILIIGHIPEKGIIFEKGWKYHLGDDLQWAQKGYNDYNWESINPSLDIHDIPELWKDSIIWLRFHFKVNDSLNGKLAMMITQVGASEIYLNGILIQHLGKFSVQKDQVVGNYPIPEPHSLPVIDTGEQVLAVRYALQPHIKYAANFGTENRGFLLTLNTVETANKNFGQNHHFQMRSTTFRIGLNLILGILYLAFYLAHRKHKTNLYFSIYALIQVVFWSGFLIFGIQIRKPEYWYYMANFMIVISVASYIYLLKAIYNLLGERKQWIVYLFYAASILSIVLSLFVYGDGWHFYALIFISLFNVEITRVAIRAIFHKKKGAWIFAFGAIGSMLTWLVFTFLSFSVTSYSGVSEYIWDIFNLSHSFFPVAFAIYIGYDFAMANRTLERKFKEVKTLSEEKNQILATQNILLEKQVAERTHELYNSLNELKSTQAQLIQSEKMASLGELTAGIAHEIQNPLNFVNNFSEINKELVEEIKLEAQKGNVQNVLAISSDLTQNLDKINQHGKRADAIVKGMLQHSRTGLIHKEPTDINALAEEYLRLSYHGFRARDNSFNSAMETNFDTSLGKLNVVPQDISRVLLNLFNNAFYSVAEKQRLNGKEYSPLVSVSTHTNGQSVEIRVKDNGMGIPEKIKDKIFQPFFTTKPTGQGTGLGLSLSYDIIIKEHGGNIRVDSLNDNGCEFIIEIPNSDQNPSL